MVDWVNVGSGLVGALIGGGATLAGARWQLHSASREQATRERRHQNAVLKALYSELDEIWNIYMLGVGNAIAAHPANEAFHYYWPAFSDYFTVFNGNAVFIGHLDNDELRRSIIKAYVMAKGTIDSFRFNNGLEDRFVNLALAARQTPTPITEQAVRGSLAVMTTYASTLKQAHTELESAVEGALHQLRNAGVHNPNK